MNYENRCVEKIYWKIVKKWIHNNPDMDLNMKEFIYVYISNDIKHKKKFKVEEVYCEQIKKNVFCDIECPAIYDTDTGKMIGYKKTNGDIIILVI